MRRLRPRAIELLAGTVLVTTACSLLADFDVPTDTSSVADGALIDAATQDRAPVGDAGAQPGVLFTDTFENAGPTCGWMIEDGTATPDTVARTGSGACRLCSTGGRIRIERILTERRPGSYQLVAHYRQVPGATTPTKWTLRLSAAVEDGGGESKEVEGALGQTYREAQVTIRTTVEAKEVVARIGLDQGVDAGVCLLVDDVTASWSQP